MPAIASAELDLLKEDAARAAARGADYEVTLGRLEAQARISKASDALSEAYAKSFGGIQWGDGLSLIAQFKGDVPVGAPTVLDEIGLPYEFQQVPFAAGDTDDLIASVREAFAVISNAPASFAMDPRTQDITITVETGARSATLDPDAAADYVSGATGAQIRVELTDLATVDLSTTTVYGGGELSTPTPAPATLRCTTGFTVVKAQFTGVATAGHCFNPLNVPGAYYDAPDFTGTAAIIDQAAYDGAWGDFAWYTTPSPEGKLFYYGNFDTKRQVLGIKTTYSSLDPVSWYGRKSNTTYSGSIYWTNFTDPNGRGHLACTIEDQGAQGDSGGPVFYGSTAVGLISEFAPINGYLHLCFSKTMYIDEAMPGVFINY